MYRILIVDDEKIERTGIRMLLSKLPEEFEVFESVNGKEALEWLEKQEADIMLTDVKMPFMNGIELLSHVSKKYPRMVTVVFSGYGEFEYARQAMRYGVAEYILKPVDPAEFSAMMQKICKKLEGSRREESRQKQSVTFFKEYVLNAIVNGAEPQEMEKRAAGCYAMDFLDQYRRMMMLEVSADFFGTQREDSVLSTIREVLQADFDYLNLNPQQSVLFLKAECSNWKESAASVNAVLQAACGSGNKSYIAVSSGIRDKSQILKRFQELELLMENRFYELESRVYMAENEAENVQDVRLDDDTLLKQMKQDIRTKDILSLKEHCDRLFLNYSRNLGFSQVYVKFMLSGLLKLLYEAIPEKTEKELNEEMERLYKTVDLSSIREIIVHNISILEQNAKQDSSSVHREVESVKRYIYAHFGEELSIEMLAEQVFLAPSYLSTIFKKDTGQNLSKFIKECRMEKARELLEGTHEKIVQISEEVGYANVSYFCQSFREYFGVSPQKFRDRGDTAGEES